MTDLFEDPAPAGNAPEFTVSELSGAVKRVIEGEFGLVRVRGEIGRVSRPASGHSYFDLKDDRAVLAAISWKGQVARMQVRPEEGMEVIATGRLTTFPGQSKYQLIVEDLVLAGAGALNAGRKQAIPYLPQVIGVVTSPSGAVIRDILHRLRDRFARHVLIWPVAVQGANCAPEVAAAIRGFNAIAPGGPVPRPDLIIVARGGGSLEDLWGFNEESVVRAAADSAIPLISAVGHETDTTLIDFAADRRAPTPTAAAEMAVPVRLDLLATLNGQGARLSRAVAQGVSLRGQRLRDLARALPRVEALTGPAQQRFDLWSGRLGGALRAANARKRAAFDPLAALIRPRLLDEMLRRRRDRLDQESRLLSAGFTRLLADATRKTRQDRTDLAAKAARMDTATRQRFRQLADRLEALERTRASLGHAETLKRGFAIVRGDGAVVTTKAGAEAATLLEIEFQDGRLTIGGKPRKG
ncbi:MAG: exodeoxyribonuclease VII large subunit, partial [Rhodobacter sp.]|nr:exodeoxyribonuclease VII large subunit [Rhodobacter sp.]